MATLNRETRHIAVETQTTKIEAEVVNSYGVESQSNALELVVLNIIIT